MHSRAEEMADLSPAREEECGADEDAIASALADELSFATELCAVCVVDDECVMPAELAEKTEEAMANQEAVRIYDAQLGKKGKPVVDLPELDTDTGPLKEDTPGYVTAAFPTVFQNGTGDPNKALYTLPKYIDWATFLMRYEGWHAQSQMRLRYFIYNTHSRRRTISSRNFFIKKHDGCKKWTNGDILDIGVKNLAGNISAFAKDIPGTEGEKRNLRQRSESMVDQIEEETSVGRPLGSVPAYFGTFTTARYQWSTLHSLLGGRDEGCDDAKRATGSVRKLVNSYPGVTAWYCALKLESLLKHCAAKILGLTDYIGVREWSPTGAMLHLHYVGWCKDAPRWGKVAADLKAQKSVFKKTGVMIDLLEADVIPIVVDFSDEKCSEWHPIKDVDGKFISPPGRSIHPLLRKDAPHPSAITWGDLKDLLDPGNTERRKEFLGVLSRRTLCHDFHQPSAFAPPAPNSSCARQVAPGLVVCNKGFPKSTVSRSLGGEYLFMDPNRADLWKLALGRNCPFINTHNPSLQLATLSNTDLQPILTKYGVIQYAAKYINKEKQRYGNGVAQIENALTALADSEFNAGNAKAAKKFGAVMSRLFTSTVADEKSSTEVYHYLQNFPTAYFSRGYLGVYLSAQSSRINRNAYGDIEGESQLETYEKRCTYPKPEGAPQSSIVTEAYNRLGGWAEWIKPLCIVDFYRYLTKAKVHNEFRLRWNEADREIVSPFPYASLQDGPRSAVGLRWAMIAYTPHTNRRLYLDASTDEILREGREWLVSRAPSYIKERWVRAYENRGADRISRPGL